MHFLWRWHGKRWNKSSSISCRPWRNWPACICPSLQFTWRVTRSRLSLLAGRGRWALWEHRTSVPVCWEILQMWANQYAFYISSRLWNLCSCHLLLFFESDHEELCNFTATARQLWHVFNSVPLVGWNITSTPLVTRCDSGGEVWDGEQSWMWKWSTPGTSSLTSLAAETPSQAKEIRPWW